MAGAIALRADAPALTLEHASAMSPRQLGDALLSPDHPVIVEAKVAIQGMRPPPPPFTPFQSPIELLTAGKVSAEPGFCERSEVQVLLAPVVFTDGKAPAAKPEQLKTQQTYSWRVLEGRNRGCNARYKSYFSVGEGTKQRAFALIRALANLQARAKAGQSLGADVTIDDMQARNFQHFALTNTDYLNHPTSEQMTEITDGRKALSSVPIGSIESVSFGRQSFRRQLSGNDLIGKDGAKRDVATIFAGNSWSLDIALDGDTIAIIRIVHEIPPPF